MNFATYGSVKGTIARAIGVCSDSTELLDLVNEAQERILNRPDKPVGSMGRYRFCANESCLVLPRQIRTVEAFAICDTPGDMIVPEWHEFLGNGTFLYDEDDMPGRMLEDRGRVASFADIEPGTTNRKIEVVSSVAEDASAEILLQGWDTNAQWVRTLDGGSWIDGENVTISNASTYSTTVWSSLVRVVKPVTNGTVRLYSYNTDTAARTRSLAAYEPSETVPTYRRVFVPGLADMSVCEDADDDCDTKAVTVYAKLQHIPVAVDNDFMIIGNVAALKLMVMAIQREEQNRFDEATHLEQKASAELEGELASYIGDGTKFSIKAESNETWGAGVFNPI